MLQFSRNDPPQLLVLAEQAELRSAGRLPSLQICVSGPISPSSSVPSHFLADGGNSSIEPSGDDAQRISRSKPPRYFLALAEPQHSLGAPPWHRRNTAGGFKYAIDIARPLPERAYDPEDRLARFVSPPKLFALLDCDRRRTSRHTQHLLALD
jgi:hypothetical protein